jgi:Papain family cysteine protease
MAKSSSKIRRVRSVRPDALDFRDLAFRPNVAVTPRSTLFPALQLAVKHQEDTSACTGFALSLVVEYLLRRAKRENAAVSPYMLYSMARRYDEFPGSKDEGSSLRGALKGWFKHGACVDSLWDTGVVMSEVPKDPKKDWWLDAVRRPLGAYYRINAKAIRDIHAALNEVGIVYASAVCHAGWDQGTDLKQPRARPRSFRGGIWTIPQRKAGKDDGGHAIALVGYNERGFLLQNSWDRTWGTWGYAILTYDDWLENAMDCWVAQIGVVTEEHRAIARSATLRTDRAGRVELAASQVLRDREISPFVINMDNNGRLSNAGVFRTSPDDVRAIIDVHLDKARGAWGLEHKPLDVCVYVHSGLVDEDAAARAAAQWIPLLYEARIFPVFLMWETGLLRNVVGRLGEVIKDMPTAVGPSAGMWARPDRWWNERLERVLAQAGTQLWSELKTNAEMISAWSESGAVLLFSHFRRSAAAKQPLRLHLIAHSAGCIAAAHMIDAGVKLDLKFESASFLAPALRIDEFRGRVLPHIESGAVRRYQQFHLTDKAEQEDPSCRPYGRSLLYLISESFEGGKQTELLGMQQHFDAALGAERRVLAHVAPGPTSAATHHGDFDDDAATRLQVLVFIKAQG